MRCEVLAPAPPLSLFCPLTHSSLPRRCIADWHSPAITAVRLQIAGLESRIVAHSLSDARSMPAALLSSKRKQGSKKDGAAKAGPGAGWEEVEMEAGAEQALLCCLGSSDGTATASGENAGAGVSLWRCGSCVVDSSR